MFIDSYADALIFKLVMLFITGVLAVVVGNWLYDKRKEK